MKIENTVNITSPHTYEVVEYTITSNGLDETGVKIPINLVRGSKLGEGIEKQDGFLTEQLLFIAKSYLEQVNIGELRNRDTSLAITHIEDALLRLQKRSEDRKSRNVQNTYQK